MKAVSAALIQSRVDQVGFGLSLACAIHCMAFPLLAAVLPLVGLGFLVEGPTEVRLVLASLGMAAGSLCWGFRLHRRWHVFVVLSVALALIVAGRVLVEGSHEMVLVVGGALLLAGCHLLNRHLCLTCHRCQTGAAHGHS
jgi:hypothetical protein